MEAIFYVVLFLIFVLGPAIKKLFESASEESTPVQTSSPSEVKEYLRKMRYGQGSSQEQERYHAPATRPPLPKQKQSRQQVSGDESLLVMESDSVSRFAAAMQIKPSMQNTSISQRVPAADVLKQRVLQNSKLTDMKKAFILSEIFNRPERLKQFIKDTGFEDNMGCSR